MSQWNDQRRYLLQTLQNIGAEGRAEFERQERIALGFYPVDLLQKCGESLLTET